MDKNRQRRKIYSIFNEYISTHGLRHTVERRRILDAVYGCDGPFTAEDLLGHINNGTADIQVSQATVYNTLALLEDARLAIRHPQVGNRARWEKAVGPRHRVYTLCDQCGKLRRIDGGAAGQAIDELKTPRFHTDQFVVYAHGLCNTCAAANNRLKRKQDSIANKPIK